MNNLQRKDTFTSLELVEQINHFRSLEGNRGELLHKNLLAIIRDEFDDEIRELKIQPTSKTVNMPNGGTRKTPMFILTASQAKQVLVRESKFVRRAVIKYIEELEDKVHTSLFKIDLHHTWWKNQKVMTVKDFVLLSHVSKEQVYCALHRCNWPRYVVSGDELRQYKNENCIVGSPYGKLALLPSSTVDGLLEQFRVYSDDILNNFTEYYKTRPDMKRLVTGETFRVENKYDAEALISKIGDSVRTIETTLEIMKNKSSMESLIGYSDLLLDMGVRTQERIITFNNCMRGYVKTTNKLVCGSVNSI